MPEIATPGQTVAAMVVLALFAAGPTMALWLLVRYRRGERIVPFESRRRPRFGLLDLLAAIVAYIVALVGASALLRELGNITLGRLDELTPDQFMLVTLVNSLTIAMACAVLLLSAIWRAGAGLSDFGLTLRRAAYDVALGAGAFLLVAGGVYLLQSILFQLFPTKHPLLEMITENPEPKYFLGAAFSAAVMAPLVEELFFRAAIQGWLEKFLLPHDQRPAQPADDRAAAGDARRHEAETGGGEAFENRVVEAQAVDNPYASPPGASAAEALPADGSLGGQPRGWMSILLGWSAILLTSLLFAGAHWGHGPAPIPLFFLSLCLGVLYQQTHRLLPCITLHALLNTTSIAMLWLSVGT